MLDYTKELADKIANAEYGFEIECEKLRCHGKITCVFDKEVDYQINLIDELPIITVYDFMSGEDFLKYVDEGYYINYDGTIANILIDGYVSDLGLYHAGISQGNFQADYVKFKDICQHHDVYVNWANK